MGRVGGGIIVGAVKVHSSRRHFGGMEAEGQTCGGVRGERGLPCVPDSEEWSTAIPQRLWSLPRAWGTSSAEIPPTGRHLSKILCRGLVAFN